MCKLATEILQDVKKKAKIWQIAFTVAFALFVLSNAYWMIQLLGK